MTMNSFIVALSRLGSNFNYLESNRERTDFRAVPLILSMYSVSHFLHHSYVFSFFAPLGLQFNL